MADAGRDKSGLAFAELEADDPKVRWQAAARLASVYTAEAAQALARALHDPEPFVRWSVAQALGRLAARATVPAVTVTVWQQLLEAAEAADPGVRAAVADTVAAWGQGAPLEPLIVMLQDPVSSVRAAAARALGLAGSRSPQVAVPALLRAIEDPDLEVRRMAINALAWCRDGAAVAAVSKLLADPVGIVRASAIRALSRLSDDGLEPTALELLEDPDLAVRVEAIRCLRLHGTQASLAALAEIEDDATVVGDSTMAQMARDARLRILRRMGLHHEILFRWRHRREKGQVP